VGKGLVREGIPYAEKLGAEAVQIFVSNPRGWAPSTGDPEQDEQFRAETASRGWPVFAHAPYLINVGSPDPITLERSVDALGHTLARAARVGCRGVVLHGGSALKGTDDSGYDAAFVRFREAVLPVLDALPDSLDLLVEPTAGGGRPLCAGIVDLERYFDALDRHPRLGVCLDTCHAYAAGEDLRTEGGLDDALARIDRLVGLDRLKVLHVNDSKDPLGSCRDRHENLGDGTLGPDVFRQLVRHPLLQDIPMLIETPGGATGHAQDVGRLRQWRDTDG
jgi:deoxyribonuclease-4